MQEIDRFHPGGMSDDHKAWLNERWRKTKDAWWTGEEKKLVAKDPDFKPTQRGPKAAKQARGKKK